MSRRIVIAAAVLLVLLVAWLRPLDELAASHAEAGLKRALAAFAAARALNAVVSVLQGTEVSGGVVVGVTTAPGQVLDPVNDLIEQFSSLMLSASVGFGAQVLLMKIGAGWLMSGLLTVAIAAWAWWAWRGRTAPVPLRRAVVVLLLVRFALPLAVVGSDLAFQAFMLENYHSGARGMSAASAALGGPEAAPGREAPRTPWWNVRERYEQVKAAAEGAVDHMVQLAVVFVVQTLLLPLLIVWLMLQLVRRLL